MTFSQIGRIQFWVAAIYTIPLLPLSLGLALYTNGLALLVLIPLWWAGFTLMGAQDAADEHSHPNLWWCSLAYHGIPLIGWIALYIGGGGENSLNDVTGYIYLVVIFLSPLLGTLLSLLALFKVAQFRKTAQMA